LKNQIHEDGYSGEDVIVLDPFKDFGSSDDQTLQKEHKGTKLVKKILSQPPFNLTFAECHNRRINRCFKTNSPGEHPRFTVEQLLDIQDYRLRHKDFVFSELSSFNAESLSNVWDGVMWGDRVKLLHELKDLRDGPDHYSRIANREIDDYERMQVMLHEAITTGQITDTTEDMALWLSERCEFQTTTTVWGSLVILAVLDTKGDDSDDPYSSRHGEEDLDTAISILFNSMFFTEKYLWRAVEGMWVFAKENNRLKVITKWMADYGYDLEASYLKRSTMRDRIIHVHDDIIGRRYSFSLIELKELIETATNESKLCTIKQMTQ
jgi:hypothetical protein